MATIKLTVVKAKALKDGTHKIRIAVCHKQETTYIITRFVIDNLSQFKNGQVVKRADAAVLNTKLRNLLNEYQDKLDTIKHQELYNCRQLKQLLVNSDVDKVAPTFKSISESYINLLKESKKNSYAVLMERNQKYFLDFTHGDILISEITPEIIQSYEAYLIKKGLGQTTIGMHMSRTRTIINRAEKSGIVKLNVNPFNLYEFSQSEPRDVDLSLDNLLKIRNYESTSRKYEIARDLFMLSFYLGGMNLIDILRVNFKENRITYVRTKSKNMKKGSKTTNITIPHEAREIIDKYINRKTGKITTGYKFTYPNLYRYISRNLTKIGEVLDISQKVVFYSARKTFAQFASDIGIPDGVIDYCLGHSDKKKGVIRFYTKIKEKQATMAIQRVIDYVNKPELYKQYIEMRSDIMMMHE